MIGCSLTEQKSTSFVAILHLPLPEDVLLRPCFGQAFDLNIKYTSQLESFFFFLVKHSLHAEKKKQRTIYVG